MGCSTVWILASLSLLALATPFQRAHVVHDSRATTPKGFINNGPADTSSVIDFRLALHGQNTAGLEERLYAISTPGSELYGQWMTQEEVHQFASPSQDSVSAVSQWLEEHNITHQTSGPFDDYLTFSLPVSQANQLLKAQFEDFTHQASGIKSIRTLQYSVPADISSHISTIHPTTAFAKPAWDKAKFTLLSPIDKRANTAAATCNNSVIPTCIQDLYSIPSNPANKSTNRIAVAGYSNQWAQSADLKAFLTRYRADVNPNTTFSLVEIDDGENYQGKDYVGVEANLDLQYTIGIATDVPNTFISVGTSTSDGDLSGFLDIVNYLNKQATPPQVLTTSYTLDEFYVTPASANQLCNAYMALSARGTSILFSSGDGGVAGGYETDCTEFIPSFPNGCPYVTSVGAVQGIKEVGAPFSSGTFSTIFARPSFQNTAVPKYLSFLGTKYQGLFNASARAYPDVSAQGSNLTINYGGQWGLVSGTSCATPVFASVVALINDRLLAAGKPALGFLNPFIYANPGAFYDITSGNNPGCGTSGFSATTGWDPVTGMGTPNFEAFAAAAGVSL